MNTSVSLNRSLIAIAVGAVLALGAVSQASAQSAAERRAQRDAERAGKSSQKKAEALYPQATRQEPDAKASAKASTKLQKLLKLYEDDKGDEARALADELIADAKSNAYDKSFAAQMGAQIAYEADDNPAALAYLTQVQQLNGLDNNGHFNAMLMQAQLLLQDEKYAESLAVMDRFLAESKSQKPEHLMIKGNALYRMERYPEAAAILKQAIDASPEPKNDWLQVLMATYFESERYAEATALAERIAAKSPSDKRAQLNLAAAYQNADQMDKAIGVLEKLRSAGQLTEEREYRQLYAAYLNTDGQEKQAISVINEGLQKGVLKGDYQTYLALAQSYYFTDQPGPAIEAYRKAAPLSTNGEAYLNLARLLWQEDRIPEAKEAARQAQAKGVKNPADVKKILALPSK